MDRRGFIKKVLAAALFIGAMEAPAIAHEEEGSLDTLNMYNTHTGEYLTVKYRGAEGYIPESMEMINRFLRCHYNDEVHRIEPSLIDLLNGVDNRFGGGNLIHVISGYRSREYNAILAGRSRSVSPNSLHTKGMAIDFMLPGVGNGRLFRTVRSLQAGGAGIYPEFVHMDVGRVRSWGTGAV